ncbi:MAG: type II secretion system major pseudopilin GspG [Candidatus Aureabacteria bacterium]|nr:type II secretion system major pseudopilin GspG [Candidatus Auribacterota bacterium]
MKMKKRNEGFTLIEIMLVVIIIGILAGIILPRLSGKTNEARISAAKADINGTLSTALDLYELDTGKYPSTEQGLHALLEKPADSSVPQNWKGPYLKKKQVLKDPWSREYLYESPGKNNQDYDLASAGPDGNMGTEDDITNWDNDRNG